MPAGPGLDALVATEALGWELIETNPWNHFWKDSEGAYRAKQCLSEAPWAPSTRIEHAFEVVRLLAALKPGETRQKFELKSPCEKPNGGHDWRCTFQAFSATDAADWAEAPTPELAICRAALLRARE